MVNAFSSQQNVEIRVVVFNPVKRSSHHKESTKIAENVECIRYGRKYLPRIFHIRESINPFTMLCWCYYTLAQTYVYKPDVILTTVPAMAPSISADIASCITKKPYCIDLRDNWISDKIGFYINGALPRYFRIIGLSLFRIQHYLFIKSVKKSIIISTVYDNLIEDIRNLVGESKPIIYAPEWR